MDMTFETVDALWRPSFVFKYRGIKAQSPINTDTTSWEQSALNPKNRVNKLPLAGNSRWRIDGSATFKTRFFAIPLDLAETGHLPPLRIDVFLPDQGTYSPALRQSLDATRGVPLLHPPAVAALGISRYICLVLDHHCTRNPVFLDRYRRLPFGSRIIINHIVSNIAQIGITIEPNYTLEGATTSLRDLHKSWLGRISSGCWPPVIDLFSLCVVRQLHDSVTLVRILECNDRSDLQGQLAIFKSGSDDFHHVLHELNLLLTTPPHSNIIGQPLAIVTKKSSFGGKRGVYGFLLPYLPSGSLRDLLPVRARHQSLSFSTRLSWSIDVASALLHVFEGGTFYSDLRPDNVLLDNTGRLVLCDFEQRGSWHEWCPPEVLYPQYIENLLNTRRRFGDATWDSLISLYTQKRSVKPDASFVQSKNRPWFSLSRKSQEKAMVYTLGLFLYCVFEGQSSVTPSIPYCFPIEPEISFPVFRQTPMHIQHIIRDCTAGAPQWHGRGDFHHGKVVRIGSLLYPPPDISKGCEESIPMLVFDEANTSWTHELTQARGFFHSDEWRSQEFGLKRPSLKEVAESLKELAKLATI